MNLRAYTSADCAEMAKLFHETVHTINARDYTEPELNAWSSGNLDLEAWDQSFLRHSTLVAVDGEKIIGFADMDETGYLDRLYVHKDHQNEGVATALCDALEAGSSAGMITTHASITAKLFFEHRGYSVVRQQQVERRGEKLTNFVMVKTNRCMHD